MNAEGEPVMAPVKSSRKGDPRSISFRRVCVPVDTRQFVDPMGQC